MLGNSADFLRAKEEALTPEELRKPLLIFRLTSAQLVEDGFRKPDYEKLFRALFVHSQGFIQMVAELGKQLSDH